MRLVRRVWYGIIAYFDGQKKVLSRILAWKYRKGFYYPGEKRGIWTLGFALVVRSHDDELSERRPNTTKVSSMREASDVLENRRSVYGGIL